MTNKKIIQIAINNLSDVESIHNARYKESKTHIHNDIEKNQISLYTSEYILTFNLEDGLYYLTFVIGHKGHDIANYMIDILSILDVEEVVIMEDFYVDKTSNKFVYGLEALETRQREILNADGKDKCVMCDYVFPIEMLDNLICEHCKETMPPYMWN